MGCVLDESQLALLMGNVWCLHYRRCSGLTEHSEIRLPESDSSASSKSGGSLPKAIKRAGDWRWRFQLKLAPQSKHESEEGKEGFQCRIAAQ